MTNVAAVTHEHITEQTNGQAPDQSYYDQIARIYFRALQAGQLPAGRPDMGAFWDAIAPLGEEAVRDADTPEALARAFNTLFIQHPALRDLIGPRPVVEVASELGMPPLSTIAYIDPQVSRGGCPWLDKYEAYSHDVSPRGFADFHTVAGIWTLSTIAARRLSLHAGHITISPALSIALVARSSLYAKTITANVAIKVLEATGLDWLLGDDETTPQRLLSDMAGKTSDIPSNYFELPSDEQEYIQLRQAMSGQRGWYYDEMGQIISAMTKPIGPMTDFMGLLRKLDGCPDKYAYSTRTHGRELIYKPYLALLGSMTPADIYTHASKNNAFWGNGFWARFALIAPPPPMPGENNSKVFRLKEITVPSALTDPLIRWHERLGIPECTISAKEGKDNFCIEREDLPQHACSISAEAEHAWANYSIAMSEMIAQQSNEDLDGSYTRLPDKALRMAMLFASLEHRSNHIELRHWAKAQELAELFRKNLHTLYTQVTTHRHADPIQEELVTYLTALQGKQVTASDIIRFGPPHLRKVPAATLTKQLEALAKSGIAEREFIPGKIAQRFFIPVRD